MSDNFIQTYQSSTNNSLSIHPQLSFSFFCQPPGDPHIYFIRCEEITISFELAFEFYNNSTRNLHEFYFFKLDEQRCYKITYELVSYLWIVQYLNDHIGNIDMGFEQQEYVEFSEQMRGNLVNYLYRFLSFYFS